MNCRLKIGALAYLLSGLTGSWAVAEGAAGWAVGNSRPVTPWIEEQPCPEEYAARLEFGRPCGFEQWNGTINRGVTLYDGGISFSYYKDSIPLPLTHAPKILANDIDGIAPLLRLLEPYVGDTERFNIVLDDVRVQRGKDGAIFIEFSQRIKGFKVGRGRIERNNFRNRPLTKEFNGFLVEPGLALFDTDSWVPLPEARRTAVTNAYPGMPDTEVESIVGELESGELEETTTVWAGPEGELMRSQADYSVVFPPREEYNDFTWPYANVVRVSLLDGTVEVQKVSTVVE